MPTFCDLTQSSLLVSKVLLSTRSIKAKLPSGGTPQLMLRCIGPFIIVHKLTKVAYTVLTFLLT